MTCRTMIRRAHPVSVSKGLPTLSYGGGPASQSRTSPVSYGDIRTEAAFTIARKV